MMDMRLIPKQRGNYVMLTAGTLELLFPQNEVDGADYLDGMLEASNEPGLLKLQGEASVRRFAALSAQMALLPNCPPDRFLIATLRAENEELSFCWNALRVLIDVELQAQPLPAVLLTPNSPVDHYVEIDGKLAFLCSAHRLHKYLFAPNGHGKCATPDNETCHARLPLLNPLPEGEEAIESLREFHANALQ